MKNFIICSILILIALFFLIREPFLDIENLGEHQHSLFSSIDTNLGFAHNENYKPKVSDNNFQIVFSKKEFKHRTDGFVGLEFKPFENPIRIVILGTSSSDPYLFSGNWPYQLHLLLIKLNIPHEILNGAVSGYNSHQLLTKLSRDVFNLGKVDLVIGYFGGNDYPNQEDVALGHPAVHPYQKKISENIKYTNEVDVSLLQNITQILKRMFKDNPKNVQMGVESFNYSKNLARNIEYMNSICEVNKTPFLFVLERVIPNENSRVQNSNLTIKQVELEKNILDFLSKISSDLKNKKYFFSIQEEASLNKKVYYDSVHMSVEGSEILANLILSRANKLTGKLLIPRMN